LNYPDDTFIERVDIGSVQFNVDSVNTYILALTERKRPNSLKFYSKFTQQMKYIRQINSKKLLDIKIVHELFKLEDYSLLYLFGKFPDNSIIIENFFDNRDDLKSELSGKDIKEFGVKEGPEVGKILKKIIEGRWIGKITSKEDEIELVTKHVGVDNDS
jgi:hypothetical protein